MLTFGLNLGPIWVQLEPKLGASWGQVGSKLRPFSCCHGSLRCSRGRLGAQDRFLVILDAKLGPTWDHVGPKLAAKWGPKLHHVSKLLLESISGLLGLNF